MKDLIAKFAIVWGAVALVGLVFGWWSVGPWLGQSIIALLLYIGAKPPRA